MPVDDSSASTSPLPRSPQVEAARAQIEAARARQKRHAASGRMGDMPLDARPMRNPPGYTLQRELHRGGQGVVYLATQESTGRQVAVKLLRSWPSGPGATSLARFEQEVEILSRLKHRNIVTIHDCGRDHEIVYLVMDYVDGAPLDAYVRRASASIRDTLKLFARVCDAVNAAHLRGVIHRDLKPGNILVDHHGEPHVLDFGLAKLVDTSHDATTIAIMTETGQFVGSLPWASPEQAQGRTDQLDLRTDVYSLGVLLYQLLTERFPYPVSGRIDEIVRHISATDAVRPSSIQPGIDRELDTLVLKCLAKEPERRYQSAGELARDIRRYLANEPIEARRDSLAYLMAKQLARYRTAAIAGAAVLAVALAGLFVSMAFWRSAERQRERAQLAATRADQEAEQARAVVSFMREVLTSVSPQRQGSDARVIDVLAAASRSAGQRFGELPEQEARVRELLSRVYYDLGLWQQSVSEQTRVAELWNQISGPESYETLKAESDLLGSQINLHRYREAEAAFRELLPRMERVMGAHHREVLAARRALAITLTGQGRYDESEPILRELRANPAIANDDALQLRLAQSLIDVLRGKHYLQARGPRRDDALDEEEELVQEWLERSTREYGAENTITLQGRAIAAQVAWEQQRFQLAAERARSLLRDTAGKLPDCHDTRVWTEMVLGNALANLGEIDEPPVLMLHRIECLRQSGPGAVISLLGALNDALPFLERANRIDEGIALATELLESLARFGGHAAMTVQPTLFLARFRSIRGQFDEAEALFQQVLEGDSERPDDVRTRLHLFYGLHLQQRGDLNGAERELTRALQCVDRSDRDAFRATIDEVLLALIDLYDASNRPDQAAEYRRMLAEQGTPGRETWTMRR